MSKYVSGRRFEYEVRDALKGLGFTVFRCAGSKPFDLIAIKPGITSIIECKSSLPKNLKKELQKVNDIVDKLHVTGALITKGPQGIYGYVMKSGDVLMRYKFSGHLTLGNIRSEIYGEEKSCQSHIY